jgi:hypothetical protein
MVGEAFEIAIAPGIAITRLQEVHFDAVRRSRRCFSHGVSPLMCRCFPSVTMVTGGRTIEYMEIFPHNLPNSPARDVDLIFHWSGLYGNFSA